MIPNSPFGKAKWGVFLCGMRLYTRILSFDALYRLSLETGGRIRSHNPTTYEYNYQGDAA